MECITICGVSVEIEHYDTFSTLAFPFEPYDKNVHKELIGMGWKKTTAVALNDNGDWVVMYRKYK